MTITQKHPTIPSQPQLGFYFIQKEKQSIMQKDPKFFPKELTSFAAKCMEVQAYGHTQDQWGL